MIEISTFNKMLGRVSHACGAQLGKALAVGALAAGLSACAAFDREGTANSLAGPAGLAKEAIRAERFTLVAFARLRDPRAPLVVYIEGDGLAWRSRTEISSDPTPTNPVALRLAAIDRAPNVVYLARPCQYVDLRQEPMCTPDYWTDRRFAEEVVRAMNIAVDRYAARASGGVRLVGFSGGGAIATLIAARRRDIIDIRTVAGNLDHVALNRYHNVSQQRGSLNPADIAASIAGIPQLHLVGARDSVVVPEVGESYARRAGRRDCIVFQMVEGATHGEGWDGIWTRLAPAPVACRTPARS